METNKRSTNALIADQERIGKDIESSVATHVKGPVRTDRQPHLLQKIVQLDQKWLTFLSNHEELLSRTDIDGSHEYFHHEYRDTVEKLVGAYQEMLSASVLESTGTDPRYDVINRGQFGMSPMYSDDGSLRQLGNPGATSDSTESTGSSQGNSRTSSKMTNNGASPKGTHIPTIEDLDDENLASGPQSNNEFPEDPFHPRDRIVPIVRDFINSSSSSMSGAINNLHLAITETKNVIQEFQTIPPSGIDPKVTKKSADRVIRQRATVERLLNTEAEQYNSSIFYNFRNQIKAILSQARDLCDLSNNDNGHHSGEKKEQTIKIPKLELTKFHGDYTQWTVFKDLFDEMINQREISKIEKFMHLRANLTGEPKNLIKALRVTGDNYDIAWNMLNARYENPRQIIKSILNKLFNMDKMRGNSAQSLKHAHDTFYENMMSLDAIANNDAEIKNMIYHQLLLNKTDSHTHALYEQSLNDHQTPATITGLLNFVIRRSLALENSGNDQREPPHQNSAQRSNNSHGKSKSTILTMAQGNQKSCDCKEKHPIYKCPKFLALTQQERFKKIRNSARCINCFRFDHNAAECKNRKCSKCDKKHNTLLHFERKSNTALLGSAIRNPNFQHVFLGTAIITVATKYGTPIKMRALLDSGAQVSILSEKMFKKTGLSSTPTQLEITGVGNASAKANRMTTIQLSSEHSAYRANLEVYIMKTVTSCQPINKVEIGGWKIPKTIQLADPEFNIPANVDILIGGELFYRLLVNGLISIGNGLPDLQNTVFGWVVIGKLLGLHSNQSFVGMTLKEEPSLGKQLEKFWKIEEKDAPKEKFSKNELACEQFFEATTKRQKDGRFIVKLQFTKEPESLGNSKDMAIRRFIYLEKRFSRDSQLKAEYNVISVNEPINYNV